MTPVEWTPQALDDVQAIREYIARDSAQYGEWMAQRFNEAAILIEDPDHSAREERFILLGLSALTRLLVVVHVYRERDDTIRLISARKATRSELTQYGARWES